MLLLLWILATKTLPLLVNPVLSRHLPRTIDRDVIYGIDVVTSATLRRRIVTKRHATGRRRTDKQSVQSYCAWSLFVPNISLPAHARSCGSQALVPVTRRTYRKLPPEMHLHAALEAESCWRSLRSKEINWSQNDLYKSVFLGHK